MPEAARADPCTSVRVRLYIENDVVGVSWISGYPPDGAQVVESKGVANTPGNHVVGAGRIAANADAADLDATTCIECQPTAEDVYSADTIADHRVVPRSEQCCLA